MPQRPWARVALLLPILVLLAGLAGTFAYRSGMERRAAVGRPAPAFALETLDGRTVSLEALRGKVVFLNFWASWCGPCRDEAPDLQRFHQAYGDRVVQLGVNYREAEDHIRPFVQEFGLTFPIVRDRDGRVAEAYGMRGVPESWFIDASGVARFHWAGPLTYAQMEAAYRQTLAEGRPEGGEGHLP
ncbi:TlpA family protein disulfide reductase [Limnochorda pilosa]|uniref:Thiol:disulfide interchange protein tlpA n=1 Tax=Limnochorda pilosa TaxID=1555112 RepID=A0A0K2SFS5_LIMPI|nr:TlpA disulfide reductase family protein [Limnochorda pilosa]BAS25956.1 thiol:disulfide interchange protein tlpA [Limnochorda pilosa]